MNKTAKKIYLGIDYGERNIGLAFGTNKLPSPLQIIDGKNPNTAINEIARIVIENKVTNIIVGLPLTQDEKETTQSLKVRRFIKLLKIRVKRPVTFVNEAYTSEESQEEMIELHISQKRRR
nr:Holliday junction resolvase RuvX [Patescibacteria group bacterium]